MEKRTLNEPTYVRATLVEAFDKFENGELSLKELRAINREMRQALKTHDKAGNHFGMLSFFKKLVTKVKAKFFCF